MTTTNLSADAAYRMLLRECLERPSFKGYRNGAVRQVVGSMVVMQSSPIKDGWIHLPAVRGRRIGVRSAIAEMCWMLRGGDNVKQLHEYGVHYWDQWADEDGNLGPVYGAQWGGEDMYLDDALDDIVNGIWSRRMLFSSWNVADLIDMALPPCHFAWQLLPDEDNSLSMVVYQRSVDVFIGAPHNWVQYSFLLQILAWLAGRKAGNLIFQYGSVHTYCVHEPAIHQYLSVQDEEIQELPDPTIHISPILARLKDDLGHLFNITNDVLSECILSYKPATTIEVKAVK